MAKHLVTHEAYKPIRITSIKRAMVSAICNFCGKEINQGGPYWRFVGYVEADFISVPICMNCNISCKEMNDNG